MKSIASEGLYNADIGVIKKQIRYNADSNPINVFFLKNVAIIQLTNQAIILTFAICNVKEEGLYPTIEGGVRA